MTTDKKDFRAPGMDPAVHEAIKLQAAARGWTQAKLIGQLIKLLADVQDYDYDDEGDQQIQNILVGLGLERQGL
jgi:hypothetical protein